MRRERVLESALAEAMDLVWYARSAERVRLTDDPADDPGAPGRARIEAERPLALMVFDFRDPVSLARMEGRQATLRWALGRAEVWDEEGAFDS